MAPTRDFKETIAARVKADPAFARALFEDAMELFFNAEPELARVILRDLVNATLGFDRLAEETSIPNKSLQRMLSASVNPGMDSPRANLTCVASRCVEQDSRRRLC